MVSENTARVSAGTWMNRKYVDIIGIGGVEEYRTPDEIKEQIANKLKAIGRGD